MVFTSPTARLEELSERRQGMVARVKASQKERDALAGDKAAAGAVGGCAWLAWLLLLLAKLQRQAVVVWSCLRPARFANCCPAPEEYLAKERECLGAQSLLAQVLARNAQVRGGCRAAGSAGSAAAGCFVACPFPAGVMSLIFAALLSG